MKFESIFLKNGCKTTVNLGSAIFKKEKILEFNEKEFQVTKGIGDMAIGNVSTYIIDNGHKIKIGIWWTREMELFDSIKYFCDLDSQKEYKHIATLPEKYRNIQQEIVNVIKSLDYLKKF